MPNRYVALVLAASLAVGAMPARAENSMGYRLLSQQEAASLPHNHGALGLDVERAQQISDSGLVFEIIRVKQVRADSAGARAGLRPGDQIIAIDGRVFPSLAVFAAYVGSLAPGSNVTADYIPSGGGPAQAQRVSIAIGKPAEQSAGLSTGTKVAIGVGAAALFGCYELGCFSRRKPVQPPNTSQGVAPRG
ncbi:PDZ domain-containing protein [Acidisphaera sp. L21]|uniref:PDZ domain-containing protein n=1 Tax=Acidisphaera sp. L21 TaxID=1641851 RepID=UPI00131BD57C|nr:PDZ domain-containing protein [Acidisphaera sp. L21]